MSATDWQTATDPMSLLSFLGDIDARKLRLFAAACCAQARLYAPSELHFRLEGLEDRADVSTEWALDVAAACAALCGGVDGDWTHPERLGDVIATERAFQIAQCGIVRELFGNPFRPVDFDPAWRTSTVIALAEGIGADLAFDRMPILADALQDAGCEEEALLKHLRGPDRHLLGCWALELCLG